MARSLDKSAPAQPRRAGADRTLAWPETLRLGPPLLLALLILLTLTLAYAVRPVVHIDMGAADDSAYLRNFNGREIDADGTSTTFDWAPGQATLTLPGNRSGIWIAVLRAADGQPDEILDLAAVAVNGVQVSMPRRPPRQIVATIPPDIAAADQLAFTLVSPLMGGPEPPPDIVGQVTLAPARTYRWSRDESSIVLPNLGRGAWQVDLAVVTMHPDGAPLDARVFANETLLATLPETNVARRASLLVPAALAGDGNLELTLRSNTFEDPRSLGVFLSNAVIAPTRAGGLLQALPPWSALFYSLVVGLGVYVCLLLLIGGAMRERRAGAWVRPETLAVLGALLVTATGGWALAAYRFPTSFMLPRLALLMIWSLLLLLALRPLLNRFFGAQHEATLGMRRATFINLLLLIFFVSYWLKAAGMLYPYFVAVDIQWHMDRVRWILDGQLPLLYGVNSPLNESTMPTAEWGENRPVIPYSPYFHMFSTVFALLPFSLEMGANMFSAVIDSTRIILIALLARKAGLSGRATVHAALLYAVLPVAFLLHSWGNIPTTFGLWWTLVATTFIVVRWERLSERGSLIILTLLLLASFLFYTVAAVFLGVFLVSFTLAAWLAARQGRDWRALLPGLRPLWLAAGAAIALSLLIYYGQYIGPIIARTVPYMSDVFARGPETVGVDRGPFSQYLLSYIPHLDYRVWPGDYLYYGIAIPLIFLIPGFFVFWKRPLIGVALAAWFIVALLFMFAGYRISMVDKQVFYLLPVMALCWAVYAERYWQRGRWGQVMITVTYVFTFFAAINQWIMRIAGSPTI